MRGNEVQSWDGLWLLLRVYAVFLGGGIYEELCCDAFVCWASISIPAALCGVAALTGLASTIFIGRKISSQPVCSVLPGFAQ